MFPILASKDGGVPRLVVRRQSIRLRRLGARAIAMIFWRFWLRVRPERVHMNAKTGVARLSPRVSERTVYQLSSIFSRVTRTGVGDDDHFLRADSGHRCVS